MAAIDGIEAVAVAAGFGSIGPAWIDGTEAVAVAEVVTEAAFLYLGSSKGSRDTEGHSFTRPESNLTSHFFSPLASNIIPWSFSLFRLFACIPSGLQRDGKNDP